MSSPSSRRQRSSATPKRSSRRTAIPSSPPDPAEAQLQQEAASSQGNAGNVTPRRSGNALSSSPMNYRSSPADIARANRERDVSSPLRQMSNTQTTQDGDRTPRASASNLIGGKDIELHESFSSNTSQHLHLCTMNQALQLQASHLARHICNPSFAVKAAGSSWDLREAKGLGHQL